MAGFVILLFIDGVRVGGDIGLELVRSLHNKIAGGAGPRTPDSRLVQDTPGARGHHRLGLSSSDTATSRKNQVPSDGWAKGEDVWALKIILLSTETHSDPQSA